MMNRPVSRPNGEETVTRTMVLRSRLGLNCHMATCLVETLSKNNCSVTVDSNHSKTDGRDIFGLMSLAAGYGTKLTFCVTGSDAHKVMDSVQELFESKFADAQTTSAVGAGLLSPG